MLNKPIKLLNKVQTIDINLILEFISINNSLQYIKLPK